MVEIEKVSAAISDEMRAVVESEWPELVPSCRRKSDWNTHYRRMVRSDFGASRGLLPSPAFGECRHGSLARRGIAMRGRAILVVSKRKRSHPRRAYGRRIGFEDAADNDSIGKHS